MSVQTMENQKKILQWVCLLTHPAHFVVFCMLLIGYLSGESITTTLMWSAGVLALFALPIALFYVGKLKQKQGDEWGEMKTLRPQLYGVGLLLSGLIWLLYWLLSAPAGVQACVASATVTMAVTFLLNNLMRLPIHALVMGSSTAALMVLGLNPFVVTLFFLLTLLVCYARYHLNGQTIPELVSSVVVGLITTTLTFSLYFAL